MRAEPKKKKRVLLRVVVVLFLLYIGVSVIGLRMEINSSRASLDEQARILEEQLLENQELEAIVETGNDDEAIERMARDMGYIYPDEQVVIIANGN